MPTTFKMEDHRPEVRAEMRQRARAGVLAACMGLATETQRRIVRVTNQLADSVNNQVEDEETKVTGKVGSPLTRAIYYEFGTGEFAENGQGRKGGWVYMDEDGEFHFTYGMRPRRPFRDAFEANVDNIKSTLDKYIGGKA